MNSVKRRVEPTATYANVQGNYSDYTGVECGDTLSQAGNHCSTSLPFTVDENDGDYQSFALKP